MKRTEAEAKNYVMRVLEVTRWTVRCDVMYNNFFKEIKSGCKIATYWTSDYSWNSRRNRTESAKRAVRVGATKYQYLFAYPIEVRL